MGDVATSYFLSQLVYQVPALLVCLAAFVLALAYLGRDPAPAILALLGSGVLIVSMIVFTAVQGYFIQSRSDGQGDHASLAQILGVIGFTGSCVRAVALAMLVAAIFVGRGKRSSPAAKMPPYAESPFARPS